MDGSQMRDARVRARLTQEQLAERLGTTLRTVGNWERGGVPESRVALLRSVLSEQFAEDGPTLLGATNLELLAELAKRLSRATEDGDRHDSAAPNQRPEAGPAHQPARKVGPNRRPKRGSDVAEDVPEP